MSRSPRRLEVPIESSSPVRSDFPLMRADDNYCCCKQITLYLESVAVLSATEVPGLPLIGLLGKIFNDHVTVQCVNCDGQIAIWPDNKPGQEIPTGDTPVRVGKPIATIFPSQRPCLVSCHVKVQAFRASRLTAILDAVNALLPELAQVTAAYFAALSSASAAHQAVAAAGAALGAASPAAKPTMLQSLLDAVAHAGDADAQAAKLDAQVKDLRDKLAVLEKLLLGVDDNLMGEFYFNFEGPLDCKEGVLAAVEDPTGGKAEGNDPKAKAAIFTQSVRAHGGEWLLTFRAVKSCPAPAKGP
jgi:hypothetical protein